MAARVIECASVKAVTTTTSGRIRMIGSIEGQQKQQVVQAVQHVLKTARPRTGQIPIPDPDPARPVPDPPQKRHHAQAPRAPGKRISVTVRRPRRAKRGLDRETRAIGLDGVDQGQRPAEPVPSRGSYRQASRSSGHEPTAQSRRSSKDSIGRQRDAHRRGWQAPGSAPVRLRKACQIVHEPELDRIL